MQLLPCVVRQPVLPEHLLCQGKRFPLTSNAFRNGCQRDNDRHTFLPLLQGGEDAFTGFIESTQFLQCLCLGTRRFGEIWLDALCTAKTLYGFFEPVDPKEQVAHMVIGFREVWAQAE